MHIYIYIIHACTHVHVCTHGHGACLHACKQTYRHTPTDRQRQTETEHVCVCAFCWRLPWECCLSTSKECSLVWVQLFFTAVFLVAFALPYVHIGSYRDFFRWSLVAPMYTGFLARKFPLFVAPPSTWRRRTTQDAHQYANMQTHWNMKKLRPRFGALQKEKIWIDRL